MGKYLAQRDPDAHLAIQSRDNLTLALMAVS
jgi:hypothetical protein